MTTDRKKPDNYAVIDRGGNVINMIAWDGVRPWTPPKDCTALKSTRERPAGIGDRYDQRRDVFRRRATDGDGRTLETWVDREEQPATINMKPYPQTEDERQ